MLASIPAIISVATSIIGLVQEAGPAFALLQKLFKKEGVTEAELADIRAQADALNAEIENQTEAGT